MYVNGYNYSGSRSRLEHPNQEKYEVQRVFVIEVEGNAYLVPFIETENAVNHATELWR